MGTVIAFTALGGGSGLTTIVTAAAMITNATQVISHDPGEVIAIAGLDHQPSTDTDAIVGGVRYSTRYRPTTGTTIVEIPPPTSPETGTAPGLEDTVDRFYLVTRGPGYTQLRRFQHPTHQRRHYNGLILVQEPDRALRPSDAEAAVSLPIVAVIRTIPAISRVIDSGLFRARAHNSVITALEPVLTRQGRAR